MAIKVNVGWVLNIGVSGTDVLEDLIVYHEDTIGALQDHEGGVVGFKDSHENLGLAK